MAQIVRYGLPSGKGCNPVLLAERSHAAYLHSRVQIPWMQASAVPASFFVLASFLSLAWRIFRRATMSVSKSGRWVGNFMSVSVGRGVYVVVREAALISMRKVVQRKGEVRKGKHSR